MSILFEWKFWIVIAFAYPILQAAQGNCRSQAFGLVSLSGIAMLAGLKVATIALAFSTLCWLSAKSVANKDSKVSYAFIALLVIALLILYKLVQGDPHLEHLLSSHSPLGNILISSLIFLGFSYSGLRMINFMQAANTGERILNPISLFGYLLPIYMLMAGPICLYRNYLKIDETTPSTNYSEFIKTINLLVTGLLYKVVIAESIRIFGWGLHTPIYSDSFFETALIFVYIFFDFAGYSLIALGIGRLLAVPTPRNFDRPFLSPNVTEFWTRWHMSLGNVIRQSVYFPIQVSLVRNYGIKHAKLIAFLTSGVSFTVVGLWHKINSNLLLWGLLMGAIMGVEKIVREKTANTAYFTSQKTVTIRKAAGPMYVFLVITGSLHLIINDLI